MSWARLQLLPDAVTRYQARSTEQHEHYKCLQIITPSRYQLHSVLSAAARSFVAGFIDIEVIWNMFNHIVGSIRKQHEHGEGFVSLLKLLNLSLKENVMH